MALEKAHEGYEYQDLLTAFFMLKEILEENDSEFIIDKKEFSGDRIDDLQIKNVTGQKKIQVKYSGDTDHVFQKNDIAGDSSYGIALDKLYNNWMAYPEKTTIAFRLCLAWKAPTDKLLQYIKPVIGVGSFGAFATKCFKINGVAIWPTGQALPDSSWKRFRSKANNIDRASFLLFCDQLILETEIPKFSLNLQLPGLLEDLVLQQVKKLGIGIFPNQHLQPEHFILSLLAIIKGARSKGHSICSSNIFYELNICTDYGTIEQNFPVDPAENVKRKSAVEALIQQAEKHSKILLVGEPGSGKSWLIETLQKTLKQQGIQSVRHYCYTKLDDLLQKERIQLNVFYGNLIHDIIAAFPELKKVKKERYASSLTELNLLLQSIQSPTYIIVDGLDHIERIFTFRSYVELSRQDIAIIEILEKLVLSPNVKIVVTSQPIQQLQDITSFHKISVPDWTEDNVKRLLTKMTVKNRPIRRGVPLSQVLLVKSAGNPLYLKYLIDEVKKAQGNVAALLDGLPAYSFNLSQYYTYLVSRLNMREDVPQVLSGINFSVTKKELEEITDSGDYVKESLDVLAPVLKVNFSQSGYVIYHESFRRFIIDRLKERLVSIEKKVFDPIIMWFETKDFFEYRKAFKYFLSFLFESGKFDQMLRYLNKSFVTDGVIHGQSWQLIEHNFQLFVKAACLQKDFTRITLLNEINKVIDYTEPSLKENYALYFEALGRMKGFSYVSDYLLFDGHVTLDAAEGLKACYVCDENSVVGPWEPYIELVRKSKKLKPEDYRYYLRGLLILEEGERLNKMVTEAALKDYWEFLDAAKTELLTYKKTSYIQSLVQQYPQLKKLTKRARRVKITKEVVLDMAAQIVRFDSVFTNETILLRDFFKGCTEYADDKKFVKQLIDLFKSRNWFYNWIIFWLKVKAIKTQSKFTYHQVKEAFDYLAYSTEPFRGKPRVCDLYQCLSLTYESFKEGLSLIKIQADWKEIIDLLVRVGNDTTTSIQRSFSGPLDTPTLFKLFGEYVCDENREYLYEVFESLTSEGEEYQLHTTIAEHKLRLSCLYSKANDPAKANTHFKQGIEYLLAYTMRKDLTLEDVIEGVEWIALIDKPKAITDLQYAKVLIDSAVQHTDGKETNYFPQSWFKRFLTIDFRSAGMYLLQVLADYRFNWTGERSLADLLCKANGEVNTLVEFYLAFSFPCNDSQAFLGYGLDLHEKLEREFPHQAKQLLARMNFGFRPRHNHSVPEDLGKRYNQAVLSLEDNFSVPLEEKQSPRPERRKWIEKVFIARKEFSEMTPDELTSYLDVNGILSADINALCFYFEQYSQLDRSLKELILTIVIKNNRILSDPVNIDTLFKTGQDIECYYWICRFVYDQGGWFQRFVNQEAFTAAVAINQDMAIGFLFELLPSILNGNFNFTFSSNLIKALISVGYNQAEIKTMWNELLKITAYRLPFKGAIEWDKVLADPLDMSKEEILICLLLTRFKASTTERFRITTMGIKDIFEHDPAMLEKPLKWFIAHQDKFVKPAFAIVLQLLWEHRQKDNAYHLKFEKELTSIFPLRYFQIDWIIADLYDLDLVDITLPGRIIYPPLTNREFDWFSWFNRRFRLLLSAGVDLEPVFHKHKARFNIKYQDQFDILKNRVHEQWVPHILRSDSLEEGLNVDLYNELNEWHKFQSDDVIHRGCLFDIHAIISYGKCFTFRPTELLKSTDLSSNYTKVSVTSHNGWTRLAHYEKTFTGTLRTMEVYCSGAVVYTTSDQKVYPFSTYSMFPFMLWESEGHRFKYDHEVVFNLSQRDGLEYYKLLWLNPSIVRSLGLTTKVTDTGLVAVSESGEVVLRIRSWMTEYFGDSLHARLSDEIPRYEGTDLIIRNDYFERLSNLFSAPAAYIVTKDENGFVRGQDEDEE